MKIDFIKVRAKLGVSQFQAFDHELHQSPVVLMTIISTFSGIF
jgi:hypothetical protein